MSYVLCRATDLQYIEKVWLRTTTFSKKTTGTLAMTI